MPYHPEQNVTIILLHNSLKQKKYYLTIHGAQIYEQVFGHVVSHVIVVNITQIRRQKRQVICNIICWISLCS